MNQFLLSYWRKRYSERMYPENLGFKCGVDNAADGYMGLAIFKRILQLEKLIQNEP